MRPNAVLSPQTMSHERRLNDTSYNRKPFYAYQDRHGCHIFLLSFKQALGSVSAGLGRFQSQSGRTVFAVYRRCRAQDWNHRMLANKHQRDGLIHALRMESRAVVQDAPHSVYFGYQRASIICEQQAERRNACRRARRNAAKDGVGRMVAEKYPIREGKSEEERAVQ
ncbi:hypothetical protein B0H19DRAFT_1240811 [Mycena capillaripes]|nr:hypothetical protein B0H19DRAFT_1240811 [Mycena capillaripes]